MNKKSVGAMSTSRGTYHHESERATWTAVDDVQRQASEVGKQGAQHHHYSSLDNNSTALTRQCPPADSAARRQQARRREA